MIDNKEIAKIIKEVFEEGYYSYATPANAYNTIKEAWDDSAAKVLADAYENS
jgi:hypothetical protein